MNKMGSRIKLLRQQLNMSQDELAKSLGVTKQAISNMENSKSSPSISVLHKLNIKFDINLNYLISGVGNFYVTKETENNLKETILNDFKIYLRARGIE